MDLGEDVVVGVVAVEQDQHSLAARGGPSDLSDDGRIDARRCAQLLCRTGTRQTVFHRAFDATPDPIQALDTLIDLGNVLNTSLAIDDVLESARGVLARLGGHPMSAVFVLTSDGRACRAYRQPGVEGARPESEREAPLRAGGLLAAPKGSRASEELSDAAGAITALSGTVEPALALSLPSDVPPQQVVLVRRTGPLDERYPRRPGLPTRRPLR